MDDSHPQDLVRHVARSTGLDDATASRVVADVMAYFGQTVEEYVVTATGTSRAGIVRTTTSGR